MTQELHACHTRAVQATVLAATEYVAAQRANERAELAEGKVVGVLDHSAKAMGDLQAEANLVLQASQVSAQSQRSQLIAEATSAIQHT